MEPAAVGLALSLGRVVNGLVDPVIAHTSDRIRGTWGRRRPFVFAAAPFLGLAFAFIWMPPPAGIFLYLTIVLCAYYALISTVVNPYLALLPEVSSTPRARIAAGAWQATGNLLGAAAVAMGSGWITGRIGFGGMGVAMGAVATVLLWLAVTPLRERPATVASAGSVWQVAVRLLETPSLRAYLAGMTLAWIGLGMVSLVLAFFVTVQMGLPRTDVGIVFGAALGVTLACFPLVTAAARRVGPFRALVGSLVFGCLLLPLMASIGHLPLLTAPQQGYLFIGLAGLPIAALYALPNTLLANLAAEHAAEHGERHEAMHFALQGILLNLAGAGAAALVGALLQLGYSPQNDVGLRLVPLCGAVFVAASLAAFRARGKRRTSFQVAEGGQTPAG